MTTLERLASILNEIEKTALEDNGNPGGGFPQRYRALALDGLRIIGEAASQAASTVIESPVPQSSVQIEGRAKGPPAITVKVYGAGPWQARLTAMQIYDDTTKAYGAKDE